MLAFLDECGQPVASDEELAQVIEERAPKGTPRKKRSKELPDLGWPFADHMPPRIPRWLLWAFLPVAFVAGLGLCWLAVSSGYLGSEEHSQSASVVAVPVTSAESVSLDAKPTTTASHEQQTSTKPVTAMPVQTSKTTEKPTSDTHSTATKATRKRRKPRKSIGQRSQKLPGYNETTYPLL